MPAFSTFVPDSRLRSAEAYLTPSCRIADIGTDHAYLPIYLVQKGLVSHALACDVNQGPIDSARANIAQAGLTDRIDTLLTDGLQGVEAYMPDSVLIFGMGGELIVRILSQAPWLLERGVDLILQPMTRASVLRRWLLENGFAIVGETLTFEDKYYQTIHARPSKGVLCDYGDDELLLGRGNLESDSPLLKGFLEHEIAVLERVVSGKERSSLASAEEEKRLLALLREHLVRLFQ